MWLRKKINFDEYVKNISENKTYEPKTYDNNKINSHENKQVNYEEKKKS